MNDDSDGTAGSGGQEATTPALAAAGASMAAAKALQPVWSKFDTTSALAAAGASMAAAKALQPVWSKFDTTSALAAAGASMAAAEALQPVWSKFDTTSALAAAGAVAATKHAVASVGGSIPGFDDVAHSLLEELQLVTDEGEEAVAFAPSDDDRAYAVLKEAAPEVAEAVDVASSKVKTPFWSRRAVRNSLAWTLLTIALALHALGAVLPEPWKSILGALLGAGDISAFSAYKLAAPPSKSEPAEQAGDTGDH